MSKRHVTKITRETSDGEDDARNDAEDEPSPEEVELAEFMGSIPGGVIIKIYKMQEGEEAWCGQAEPGIVTEGYLYRHFGPGRYYLKGIMNGRYVKGAYKRITIYEPPVKPEEMTGKMPVFDHENGRTNILLEQINRQHELVLKMIEKQGDRKHDMNDLLQLAQIFKDNQKSDVTSALPSMVELFKTVLESTREVATGEDPKMVWPNLVMKAIDKLQPMIVQIAQAKGKEVLQTQDAQQLLARGVAWLKQKAEKGSDPIFYADFIMDNLDDPVYKTIAVNLMNVPFEQFGQIDPEIVKPPLKEWFLKCYNALHEGLTRDAENTDAARPGGGPSDSSDDADSDYPGNTQSGSPESGA